MKKNGFISSALLYSMLALFLIIILCTLAILGNRKLSMDKVKSDALNTIRYEYAQMGYIYALYDGFQAPNNTAWSDQSGNGHNATLTGFSSSSYQNRHLIFTGNNYINTNITQTTLGSQITLQTVLNIKNISSSSTKTIGLWGWYDKTNQKGIYAEIGPMNDQFTDIQALNFCVYINTSSTPQCVSVAQNYFQNNYLNKIIELTVVINNEDIQVNGETVLEKGIDVYINGAHYDRLDIKGNFEIKGTDTNFIIGQSNFTNGSTFIGDLYNFTIYQTALTYDEVMKNYETDKFKYNITS